MSMLAKLLGRATESPVPWVDPGELVKLLQTASPPRVVDVRGASEFSGPLGHIDSAQNIPLDELSLRTPDLLAQQRPLVLVCHTDKRSSAAAEQLRRAGGTEITVLRGGMVAWRSMPR